MLYVADVYLGLPENLLIMMKVMVVKSPKEANWYSTFLFDCHFFKMIYSLIEVSNFYYKYSLNEGC